MSAQIRNYQHEIDGLRESIDEEGELKADVQRQLAKANAEIQQWKSRFESEGLNKAEELDEQRSDKLF